MQITDKTKSKRYLTSLILKILLLIFLGICFFYAWVIGCIIMAFSMPNSGKYAASLTLFLLGLFACIGGAIFHMKVIRRISYYALALALIVGMSCAGWEWWTKYRFPSIEQQVDWWQYRPYEKDNKLVKVHIPAEYKLSGSIGYPRLNGAYALYPIYAAMAQEMYPEYVAEDFKYLDTSGSDYIYNELLKGDRDLIFALAPSKQQSEEAMNAGVTYELTPFCKDAFVFYVNAKNPIDNLTTEQVKGIYSGRITDWQEVGAPQSTKIIPFQRNEGSGSQTTLQKLMGETAIMTPLKEDRVGGMGDIINDTANYRNYNAALGFSFRFYSTELLQNKQIKLLSIDGVTPTLENIANGTYPLVTTAYMVTAQPRNENVRKIVDFMLSQQGQDLVAETGYVPVGIDTLQ